MNTMIAGRYYITEYLGSAAFSKVVQAHDLLMGVEYHDADNEQSTFGNLSDTTCASSLQNSEPTPNANVKASWEKSLKMFQCCIPNLIASSNFSENKKMRALSNHYLNNVHQNSHYSSCIW